MKKIVFETHGGDEWKIVYKKCSLYPWFSIYPYKVIVYLKREKRKSWQKEYERIGSESLGYLRYAEEEKQTLIKRYYDEKRRMDLENKFFGE